MSIISDIDIDFSDRDKALEELVHVKASKLEKGNLIKHNVGVYFQDIPVDPFTGFSSIPYEQAKERGYFKIDFLNVSIYKQVRDENHLIKLMNTEPCWEILLDKQIVEENQLFQINNHFHVLESLKPQNIEQLAMIIAIIRPGKKHLIGKSWIEIEKEIWEPLSNGNIIFKKSHAIAYSIVLVIQMNLLVENI